MELVWRAAAIIPAHKAIACFPSLAYLASNVWRYQSGMAIVRDGVYVATGNVYDARESFRTQEVA